MSGGVSEAFVAVMEVIASVVPERPLPMGLIECTKGDWEFVLNASAETISRPGKEPLEAFTIIVTNTRYLVVAILAPDGGMVAGMLEADLLEQMKKLAEDGAS